MCFVNATDNELDLEVMCINAVAAALHAKADEGHEMTPPPFGEWIFVDE
jgi:hypothetical protein